MKPFADDSAAITLDGLHIENGVRSIALHGSLDITHDKAGLEKAQRLLAHVQQIVTTLKADADLPDTVQPPAATVTVDNPFD